MFKYCLYKFGQFCVNHLPLDTAYRISVFLSDLQYYFSPRDRRAVRNNLKAIVPPGSNLNHLTREVFRNFGLYLVEFFKMVHMVDRDFVSKRVTIEGINDIKQALSHGKGGIFITGHIGNWEMGGIIMSLLGYPFTAVALPHKERPVNDLFNQQRESKGITIVPPQLAIRKCLEALQSNELIALVADRDFTSKGEIMDFLGRKRLIPKGPAILSIKTGAPIIPIFLIREAGNRFRLLVDPPIYPPRVVSDDVGREEQIELMEKYKTVFEKKIRQYPTQWLMFREFGLNENRDLDTGI